ncbi:MAG: hypothetical protein FWE35_29160 [Streptosporangiales bacterium]|nr:hypothetical protein [Streptosporangiales bacterium]
MDKLSGDAAEAALAEAWKKILGQDPAGQEIIHVLPEPAVEPTWIAEFEVFQKWVANGQEASDEIWRSFAEIAGSWPYIVNARRAAALGIPNVRILVLTGKGVTKAGRPWLQYLAKVHLPAISAMSGETLYKVWASDCQFGAGVQARDHDVNLFGAAGVMIAGGENGDIDWRAFLDRAEDPDLFQREVRFVTAMRDFSVAEKRAAVLPPVLQL